MFPLLFFVFKGFQMLLSQCVYVMKCHLLSHGVNFQLKTSKRQIDQEDFSVVSRMINNLKNSFS